jgi:hypothetical protein
VQVPWQEGSAFSFALYPYHLIKSSLYLSCFLQKTPFVTFAVFPFYLLDPVFPLFYTFLIQKNILIKE